MYRSDRLIKFFFTLSRLNLIDTLRFDRWIELNSHKEKRSNVLLPEI